MQTRIVVAKHIANASDDTGFCENRYTDIHLAKIGTVFILYVNNVKCNDKNIHQAS